MLKEVESSGQISLGKGLAGQFFDVIFHADGRVEMLPMQTVAAVSPTQTSFGVAPEGWRPPGGYDTCSQWALDNRVALEAYAQGVGQDGTAAEQLQRYLAQQVESTLR